jgi:hypothetical protein
MQFNAKKCYIISIKAKSSYLYSLCGHILQSVPSNPYLGVTISDDLKWTTHINRLCGRASSTLGFLRRNLRRCPKSCRLNAYTSLVKSTLEYGAVVWDPFLKSEVEKLERIQRKAARFITGDYKSRDPGCITRMLKNLDLPTLQQRRKELRLTFLFKVVEGLVPVIPSSSYIIQIREKGRIQPSSRLKDYSATNIVDKYQTNNSKCYRPIGTATTVTNTHSLFFRTVYEWNQLEEEHINATSVTVFKNKFYKDEELQALSPPLMFISDIGSCRRYCGGQQASAIVLILRNCLWG